jgi:putative membrane protein
VFVMRVLTNAVAVLITVALVPGLRLVEWRAGAFLVVGLVFGLLNAVVKPALQFVVLRYLVATYGVVVVLVNAALLWALEALLPEVISSDRLWPVLVGGVLVGVIGLLLETLAGLSPPVVTGEA